MMMIGLGKHAGALAYHRILLEQPYDQVVRSVGRTMLRQGARSPSAWPWSRTPTTRRPWSRRCAPERLRAARGGAAGAGPATGWRGCRSREADLLIVDEIGKDISGSGMDTNVVGRKRAFRDQPAPPDQPDDAAHLRPRPDARTRTATPPASAWPTSRRRAWSQAMNYRATVINCLTAGYPEGAILPVHFDTDREVLDAALAIIGTRRPRRGPRPAHPQHAGAGRAGSVRACLDEPRQTEFAAVGAARPLAFDGAGNLPAFLSPL